MWESRRDFHRVWEGWEAGFMAFHAFHTLSFPWPALGFVSSWKTSHWPEPQFRHVEFAEFDFAEVGDSSRKGNFRTLVRRETGKE